MPYNHTVTHPKAKAAYQPLLHSVQQLLKFEQHVCACIPPTLARLSAFSWTQLRTRILPDCILRCPTISSTSVFANINHVPLLSCWARHPLGSQTTLGRCSESPCRCHRPILVDDGFHDQQRLLVNSFSTATLTWFLHSQHSWASDPKYHHVGRCSIALMLSVVLSSP